MKLIKNWLNRSINLGLSRKAIITLISLSFFSTLTEVFGVTMFLPIIQFIQFDGDLNLLTEDTVIWSYLIDIFNMFNVTPALEILLAVSFSLFLFRQIFVYFRVIYNANISQYITKKQRTQMFDAYLHADSSYHDKMPVGNLVNVMTTEVNRAVNGIMAPTELVVLFVMLTGYITVLFLLSWQMTAASIIILMLTVAIPFFWIKKSKQAGRDFVEANTSMSEFLVGRLHSPRLIRLAGVENAEKTEFNRLTDSQRKIAVFISKLRAKTEVSMEPFVIGMSMIFLYYAVIILKLQIEVVGLYLIIVLRLMPIVKSSVVQWQSVQRFIGAIEAIESRINTMESSIEIDTGSIELTKINSNILFEEVSYRYLTEKNDTLIKLSFEILANKTTAIVGPSGSGKSTLIDLLPLIRRPTHGSILIDGVDLKEIALSNLRSLISYAPQNPQIFGGTVKNHILYGKVGSSDREVIRAAELAGADKFINKLPLGYDTLVGENAIKLSGGQRKRLDLARALIAESPILILDEPTSNLDANSSEKFIQTIKSIGGMTLTTIIIISHELRNISDVDQIIVLNNGRVESIGTHNELIDRCDWYSNAWNSQTSQ